MYDLANVPRRYWLGFFWLYFFGGRERRLHGTPRLLMETSRGHYAPLAPCPTYLPWTGGRNHRSGLWSCWRFVPAQRRVLIKQRKSFLVRNAELLMVCLPHRLHLSNTSRELSTRLVTVRPKWRPLVQASVTEVGIRSLGLDGEYSGRPYQKHRNHSGNPCYVTVWPVVKNILNARRWLYSVLHFVSAQCTVVQTDQFVTVWTHFPFCRLVIRLHHIYLCNLQSGLRNYGLETHLTKQPIKMT